MTADPSETPAGTAGAGTADLTLDATVAAADVPPELIAQSLGQYVRASWLKVRGGDSGVLPVIVGLVVVAVGFQIANSKFLSAQNLVNLFEQSTVYMLLAMAEIFALLLGEIDLSVGLVMGLGSVVVAELVQPSGANWPWWAAIIVTLLACAAVGAIQGTLVARFRMPSFIVTLGGLLILEGVAIIVLGGSLVGIGNSQYPNELALYDIFWGSFDPVVGWILLAVLVASRRHRALEARRAQAPPLPGGCAPEPHRNEDHPHRGRGNRGRRHLQRQPRPLRDDRGGSLHHPDRPRRPRRLYGPAAANPLRPLRVRHRRQRRGGGAGRRPPGRDTNLELRPRRA